MKTIIKRGLGEEDYRGEKIEKAMEKAFLSEGITVEEEKLHFLLGKVEEALEDKFRVSVEEIQNAVEESLMQNGDYRVARAYILYREKRTLLRHLRQRIKEEIGEEGIEEVLKKIQKDFPDYDLSRLSAKYLSLSKGEQEIPKRLALLTRAAAELTTQEEPNWEKIAGRLLSYHFHKELKRTEESRALHSFYEKLCYLTEQGLYGSYILEAYTKEEVEELAKLMDEGRNDLFTYSGLDLLLSRYVIRDRQHIALESPQEMYLGIAMHLAMKEEKNRAFYVKEFYDIMSLHQVTMATPTQSNARKPYHQLSSCFIDTVADSLDGIYQSISRFADVSKYGGGMGMYFGKVRSRGGKIRGFEGASGGVIRWIRVVNDTAVAVDQLGMRQGAVAVYLDAWHKDLPEFLQLRTNNGDDRMKAHDVFPAVCYPDLFWKKVKEDLNQEWYLMDPHDIFLIKGYCLEDFYGEEWESRYEDCVRDNRISKRVYVLKDIVRLILKSAVETGTPFAFYRDTVNRMNPNKHKGIIYCSNLCTEIAQNMKEAEILERKVITEEGDEVIVSTVKPGDFVVCNLASLCLGNIDVENKEELQKITKTVVRALDNVIDLNFYPVKEAELTNKKYRAIGLGVSGYHHMLAEHHIAWESEEHLRFVDTVLRQLRRVQSLPRSAEAIENLPAPSGKRESISVEETIVLPNGRRLKRKCMKESEMHGFWQRHRPVPPLF